MGEKLVLDLETQREFNEVEGRKHELMASPFPGGEFALAPCLPMC